MKELDNCLHQIAKVRSVAQDQEVAYVARSRLGRLVLAVVQLVGRLAGGSTSDRPGRLDMPTDASDDVRTLARLSNELFETTKTLVQPSEPLDLRWQTGWSELLAQLDEIEHLVQAMKGQSLEVMRTSQFRSE